MAFLKGFTRGNIELTCRVEAPKLKEDLLLFIEAVDELLDDALLLLAALEDAVLFVRLL
jgi:hypothetical protein